MKGLPRARFKAIAAIVAVAAQLVLCSASVLEGRFGADARAHVEANGTRIHHAHDEASCAACTGRHLLASSNLEAARPLILARSEPGQRFVYAPASWAACSSDTRSRAPPAVLA
jgi:hypothetical protein